MSHAVVNEAYPLRCLAGDGATGLYPLARIYDSSGSLFTTVSLSHLAGGLYGGSWTPPAVGHFHVVYAFYSDSGHSIAAGYDLAGDEVEVTDELASEVLDALLEDHLQADSVGEALTLMRGLLQHNFRLDELVHNSASLMTSGRIRIFATAEDADEGTNSLATYAVAVTADAGANAGRPLTYKCTRTA